MDKTIMYFVVSLPRTGTTSLTKMANICGLKAKHCPIYSFKQMLNRKDFNFYSDTPTFVPSIIDYVINQDNIDSRFIFIDREYDRIYNSWKKIRLLNNYANMDKQYKEDKSKMSPSMLFDYQSYLESFGGKVLTDDNYADVFANHKNVVISKISNSGRPLLIYNFGDGWKPFCDFIGVDIPNQEIPHLNQKTIFEK